MANIIQRVWRSGPRKARRSSWGYTAMIDAKQVRKYNAASEDAQNALAARLLEVEAPPPAPTPKTVAEVGQEYIVFKRAKGKRTIGEDQAKLARFTGVFGADTPITDVTAQRIASYERQRVTETSMRGAVVAPATVNRELAMLRHLLRLAEEWG